MVCCLSISWLVAGIEAAKQGEHARAKHRRSGDAASHPLLRGLAVRCRSEKLERAPWGRESAKSECTFPEETTETGLCKSQRILSNLTASGLRGLDAESNGTRMPAACSLGGTRCAYLSITATKVQPGARNVPAKAKITNHNPGVC